uniref:SWIM-type domain-containing protein n=2 Tax=Cacopsylla melanoneura TaxID=428564 RepID=A0A8D8YY04_9HEMI
MHRREKWAMCFRKDLKHGNVNTTGHVESFHNRLKKVYFKRNPNKRVDDLLNILLSLEQDDFASRLRDELVGGTTEDRRHCVGIALSDDCIEEINAELRNVKSLALSNEKTTYLYHIDKVNSACEWDWCYIKCQSCHDLCSHIYVCSCSDIHPICKHVHKLHSLINRGVPCPMVENTREPDEVQLYTANSILNEPSVGNTLPSQSNAYQKLKMDLSKLMQMVNEETIPGHLVSTVSIEIRDIVTKCSLLAGSCDSPGVSNIPNPVTIAPKQKLVTQQQQTLNPFKLKKKNKFVDKKAVFKQREAARAHMLSLHDSIQNNNTLESNTDFDIEDYLNTHCYE